MASTDGIPLPVKNRAYRLTLRCINFTTGRPITGGLTGLACTISKDGAAPAAIAGTITEIGTTGWVNIDLTNVDMGADVVAVEPIATNANFYLPSVTINPAEPGDFPVNVVAQEGVDLSAGVGAIPSLAIIDQGVMQSCTTSGGVIRALAAFPDNYLRGAIIQVKGASDPFHMTASISANAVSGDTVTFDTALPTAPTGSVFYRIFGIPNAPPALVNTPAYGEHILRQNEATSTQRRVLLQFADLTTGLFVSTISVGAAELKVIKVGAAGTITEANFAGTLTQIGATANFVYEFTSAELDTVGLLGLRFTKAGYRETTFQYKVVAYNPGDAVRLGLTALPNANAGAAGGLSGPVTHSGTTQAGGTTGAVVLAAAAVATDGFYIGQKFKPVGANQAQGGRIITGYVGATRTATLSPALSTAIGAGEAYQIEDAAGASTGGGGGGLDAAATRAALGLAAANMDAQLSAISVLATGVKSKTDQLTFAAGAVASNVVVMAPDVVDASALAASAVSEIAAAVPGGGGGGGGTGDALQSTLLAVKAKTDQLAFNSGKVVSQVSGMDPDVVNASALAADAVNEIRGSTPTEVTAIKAKTDQLTFTGTDLNANMKRVVDKPLTGDGVSTPVNV